MTRSPETLLAAVNALDVANNPLFRKGKLLGEPIEAPPGAPLALWNGQQYGVIPYTRCNGYAGVLFAMLGCNVPWLTANGFADWFPGDSAKALGWRSVDYAEAVDRANAGYPVVVVSVEQPHGHIAVGMPSPGNDPVALYVSAAGATNSARMRFVDQFGQLAPRSRFYTHD